MKSKSCVCSKCGGDTLYKNIAFQWRPKEEKWVPMVEPINPQTAFCYHCGITVILTINEENS